MDTTSDETTFGNDTGKVRQLLGAICILVLEHKALLTDLLDHTSFTALYQNQAILENLSYWFTEPSFKIQQTNKDTRYVINILKAFIRGITDFFKNCFLINYFIIE